MGIFSRLVGGARESANGTRFEVTGRPPAFTTFAADPYANDVFRSGVHSIAQLAAKLKLQPKVTFTDGTTADCDAELARVLQVAPNQYMTAYDLLYQVVTHLYLRNNAFVYVQRDQNGRAIGLWPLHVSSVEFIEHEQSGLLCAFRFANGKAQILPYADVIHLRRHFNSQDINGDGNGAASTAVGLAEAQNRAAQASMASAGTIRGIVRSSTALAPTKLEALKKDFETRYLGADNTGGIVATSAEVDFIPMEAKSVTISAEDQRAVASKIYAYLGVPEAIVRGEYTDDVFQAFSESTLESLAMQLELELTRKLYSPAQIARGRHIAADTSRLAFMSTAHRVQLFEQCLPTGVLSVNEARGLLGLAPLDQDRRLQSLNFASVQLVDKYQLLKSGRDGIKSLGGADDAQE